MGSRLIKNIILSALKACLGSHYDRIRARIFWWQEIWLNRIRNVGVYVSQVTRPSLDRAKLSQIKRLNRTTLRSVSQWSNPALLAGSVCNYGISPGKVHLLDADIGDETTLSDIIAYHCAEMKAPVHYLEIGVSVGKNFMQVMKAAREGDFVGFDIEDISPVITRDLKQLHSEEWPALADVSTGKSSAARYARKTTTRLDVFEHKLEKKTASYLAGDIFDERCWKVLGRKKYNVIFSDAMHTGPAIKYEYDMMRKYDLFGPDQLLIVWDDLHFPGMREAFLEITDDLRAKFSPEITSRSLSLVYGWAGRHEGFRHLVGLFQRKPIRRAA